jgi:HEAT repeat protein
VRGSILLVLALLASVHAAPDQRTLRAVKAAIARLRSSHAETRIRGALELSRYGAAAKSAVPYLAKALCDPEDWRVKDAARQALTRIGQAGVPGLIKALKDRDPNVRAAICTVLQEVRLVRHLEPHGKKLTVVLKDKDDRVRRAAVELFIAWGIPAIEPLLPALRVSHAQARSAAVEALAGAAVNAPERLGRALEEEKNARVCEGVCIAVGRMGRKGYPAADALVGLLRDANEGVRAEAARAVGKTGAAYDDACAVLFEGLAAESERVREGCIDGLAAYGSDSATELVERLGDKNPVVRASATESLGRMGPPGVERLQDVLDSGSAAQRQAAVGLLQRATARPRASTVPGLLTCLEHEDVELRRAAVAALGRLGRTRVVKRKHWKLSPTIRALLGAATDEDAAVRAATLVSLGRLGTGEARDALAKAAQDADARVRTAAHFARWGTGEDAAAALAGLRAGLTDPATRAAAAVLLGRMRLAAEAAVPEVAALLEDPDPAVRRAAAEALGRIVRSGRVEVRSLRGTWAKKARAPVRRAIEKGLKWLAENQEADGFWDSDIHGGGDLYDAGVTGLAVWAFLGAGHTDRDNPHAKTVRNGLDYLLRAQDIEGVMGSRRTHSFQTLHACAAIAMAEAWLLTGDPRYAHAVRAAVDFVEASRNPGLAWRYEPRGGENDTHVTTWMVTVLRLADLGGFAVDPATYRGAATWIERMTDPNFGQIGYNYPGGAPARPEGKQDAFPPEFSHAMTAAGAWCRHLLGGAMVTGPTCKKGIALCGELLPLWRTTRIDLYYFHFGTLAVHQDNGRAWGKWKPALEKAFVSSQSNDGSWPPAGVWGTDGGRVYSTAFALLSLLVPYRYAPGFATKAPLPRPQQAAAKALKRALKDDDPAVRAAAKQALGRILPPGW